MMKELRKRRESDPSEHHLLSLFFNFHIFLSDRVLYARKSGDIEETSASNVRGENITVDDAMVTIFIPLLSRVFRSSIQKLKSICYGGPGLVPEPYWLEAGLVFHPYERLFGFGLQTTHGAQKAFQVIIQAHILKHLFFGGHKNRNGKGFKPRLIKGRPVPV